MNMTFAMIKSGALYQHAMADILCRIQAAGITVLGGESRRLSPEEIEQLYANHIGTPYWEDLRKSVSRGVYLMALGKEGGDIVAEWRALMGATKSAEAPPGTIRYDYGNRQIVAENAVHGSDSNANALKELFMFFPDIIRRHRGDANNNLWSDPSREPAHEKKNGG